MSLVFLLINLLMINERNVCVCEWIHLNPVWLGKKLILNPFYEDKNEIKLRGIDSDLYTFL